MRMKQSKGGGRRQEQGCIIENETVKGGGRNRVELLRLKLSKGGRRNRVVELRMKQSREEAGTGLNC